MREIKFRGKDIDQNEWRYGSYVAMAELDGTILHYIVELDGQQWIVFPDSVEQYTGFKDKKGKEIYGGDIIKTLTGSRGIIKYGEYQDSEFMEISGYEKLYLDAEGDERFTIGFYAEIIETNEKYGIDNRTDKWVEVVGNIHENNNGGKTMNETTEKELPFDETCDSYCNYIEDLKEKIDSLQLENEVLQKENISLKKVLVEMKNENKEYRDKVDKFKELIEKYEKEIE